MKGGDRSTKNTGAMGGARLLWSPAVSSKGVKPEEKGSRARGVAVGPPPPHGGVGCTHPGGICFTQT